MCFVKWRFRSFVQYMMCQLCPICVSMSLNKDQHTALWNPKNENGFSLVSFACLVY